jgi:ankyrin repeat protein
MLKFDNIGNFSQIVNKDNINKCYYIKDSSYSLLSLAIKTQSKELFNKLIEENANLNLVCDDKSPLMFAAKYGAINFAKKLLEKGADKNLANKKGYKAYDYAVNYKFPEIAELLK